MNGQSNMTDETIAALIDTPVSARSYILSGSSGETMTSEEIQMLVSSGAYAAYQAMAGGFLAGALLNPDPKAAKACLDAYVKSQKDLCDILRGSSNG